MIGLSLVCFIALQLGWLHIHFTIMAGLLFLVTVALIVALQWLGRWPAPTGAQLETTSQRQAAGTVPVGVKCGALVLVLAAAAVVIVFR